MPVFFLNIPHLYLSSLNIYKLLEDRAQSSIVLCFPILSFFVIVVLFLSTEPVPDEH